MTTAQEALIVLAPGQAPSPQEAEVAIATAGARIVAGYLPHALLIQAPDAAIGELRQSLAAATLYTEAVPATVVETTPEPLRSVLTTWNQRRSQPGAPPEPRGRGLAWDAPGFLPPDPPPEVRAMLRRREQELGAAPDSSSSSE